MFNDNPNQPPQYVYRRNTRSNFSSAVRSFDGLEWDGIDGAKRAELWDSRFFDVAGGGMWVR